MRLLVLIAVSLIFALGLMMVFNTSSAEVLDRSLHCGTRGALYRQIAYACIGLFFAALVWRIGFIHLLRLSPLLLLLVTVLLVLVYVPGVGQVRNGAHRWIGVGNFTFQPSELVKYLLPMVYIEWITCKYKHQVNFLQFCKIISLLAIPMFLVMLEPDNGSAAVMGATLLPLFYISGIRMKYWAIPVILMLVIGSLAALQLPYVRGRLEVYLHPELDLKGKGHQPYQAKIAAGAGKIFGRGPGGSLQKLTYLPEAQNDYIAAIYAEEFGFVGTLFLITLYMLIAFAGFAIAMRTSTVLGCYLAMTITYLIVLQAFLNLGVVSGLLPSKGVNLPFFSQGGTSLITNLLGLTVLLNIGKNEKKSDFKRERDRRTPFPGASARRGLG